MTGFLSFMWVWFGIVTGTLSYFSGAPEPFLGWAIVTILVGPPLLISLLVDHIRNG